MIHLAETGIVICIDNVCNVVAWPWVFAVGLLVMCILAVCFVRVK